MSSTECCNKIKVLLQQNTSFSMWKFLESGHLFIFFTDFSPLKISVCFSMDLFML